MDIQGCCNGSMFIFTDLLPITYKVKELHPKILSSHIQCLMYLMMQCTYYLSISHKVCHGLQNVLSIEYV